MKAAAEILQRKTAPGDPEIAASRDLRIRELANHRVVVTLADYDLLPEVREFIAREKKKGN